MDLLSKEQRQVESVIIAKHDTDILSAVNELRFCVGIEARPIMQDVLFHWLHTFDSEMDERSTVIYNFQRIMEFIETLAKIEMPLDKKGLLTTQLNERAN
jgi:hypothetical protein